MDAMDTIRPKKPLWRRYWPLVCAGLTTISIVVWLRLNSRESVYRVPFDQLSVATITEGLFEDFVSVRGVIAPFTTHYLPAADGGTVQKVFFEDGALVEAGQPIIALTNTALQSQIATREADTASQINALDNTRLQLQETRFKYQRDLLDLEHQLARLTGELERDKVLLDGNAIAPAIYKQEQEEYAYDLKLREVTIASRDAQYRVQEEQLHQLQEVLARLNINMRLAKAGLASLTISAPISGQLTALDAVVGQSKPPGAILGQVDSRDRFKLTAYIDEFYLSRIQIGQQALLTTDRRESKAQIVKIYPQVTNGTFKADLNFLGVVPADIHNGHAVDLKIQLGGTAKALMMPNGPFYQDTGGNWAFVISADGTYATRRIVRLGRRNPEFVEVLEGLKSGDKVIVSSYGAFATMNRVQFQKVHNSLNDSGGN